MNQREYNNKPWKNPPKPLPASQRKWRAQQAAQVDYPQVSDEEQAVRSESDLDDRARRETTEVEVVPKFKAERRVKDKGVLRATDSDPCTPSKVKQGRKRNQKKKSFSRMAESVSSQARAHASLPDVVDLGLAPLSAAPESRLQPIAAHPSKQESGSAHKAVQDFSLRQTVSALPAAHKAAVGAESVFIYSQALGRGRTKQKLCSREASCGPYRSVLGQLVR